MSAEPILPMYPWCLRAIEDELNAMDRRLQALISKATPTQDTFAEIATIHSNVAYIFVYLEGNRRHLDYEPLMRHRDAFFNDHEREEGILELLSGLRCPDPKAEADRHIWVAWLYKRVHLSNTDVEQRIKGFHDAAKRVLHEIDEDQAALLRRLGVKTGRASAATVFYRMVSSTESPVTRSKLAQAWRRERDRRLNALTKIIDEMIAERRLQTKKKGFNTVVEETFRRCSVSEPDAWEFVHSYLARSLSSHLKLAADIREATGCLDNPMDHFGYYLRTLLNGAQLPLFKLDTCLDYLLSVARRVFGITVARHASDNPDVITVVAWVGDTEVGTINFDLLDTGHSHAAADVPLAMDRAYSIERVTCPSGHVLCWFQRGEDGVRRITFESAHSLFHGLGHAVNHLLIRKRQPNQSGLEYLPLERLENLSMWFEKWVYHPQFADSLSLTPEEREGLALCQRVMMLEFLSTNLESAVTAALDFDVHRRTEEGLEHSFHRLDDEFAIADHISFGLLPQYFTAPMFRANPGASFVYLWGAADSAAMFAPFMRQRIEEMSSPAEVRASLSSCFDFDKPSIEPDIEAAFDFYGAATLK